MIPRPNWLRLPSFKTAATLLLSLFILLFLTSCVGNVLEWSGKPFLALYGSLLLVAIVMSIALLFLTKPKGKPIERFDSAYDLAFVRGGKSRVFAAMVASLIAREAVEFRPGKVTGGLLKRPRETPPGLEDLSIEEQRFLSAIPTEKAILLKKLFPSVDIIFHDIRRKLVSSGMLVGDAQRFFNQILIALPMISLISLGVAKAIAGLSHGKPIGYLIVLLALTVGIMFAVLSFTPRRTRATDNYWKREKAALKKEVRQEMATFDGFSNTPVLPLAVAVLGTAALKNLEGMESIQPAMKLLDRNATNSSGGCGGGCGSGCGGGGCGGCGGCG
ncbi:TIGR04222 domain-containing membrane protein [Verrucomicrobiales bacterium]|nr:TIGR04222 domain-containing membrane protein [Verrucomicrobiales bacterium]